MTTKTIPLTSVSLQQAKPDTRFGQPSILPVATVSQILARASLTGIPTGATVQSATLTLRSRNSPTYAGARTVNVRRALAAFSTASTWNTKPTTTATDAASTSITAAPFGTFWNFDVTNIAQSWISGTNPNFGFVIFGGDTNVGLFQGATAPWGPPVLTITYVTTAVIPTALHPSSGAVSKSAPTLTFQTPADTQSIQVQIDQVATNLVSNPSATTNTTGWSSSGCTFSRDAAVGYGAAGAFKVATSGAAADAGYMYLSPTAPAAPGPYSVSLRVMGTGSAVVQLYSNPAGTPFATSTALTLNAGFQALRVTGTAPAGTTDIYVVVRQHTSGTQNMWVDAVSLTQTALPQDIDSSGVQQIGFDSGEVAATAGLLDLSATSFLGLPDGAATTWRARVKNALGWSDWSTWVAFSRAAWKTLTVSSPSTTSEDPSPVITATYGGTVTSWRALLKDSLGAVLQDSGWTAGATPAFGTTKSVGAAGTAVVRVRDNVVRDATPGDPDYVETSKAFTVAPSGTPTVLASLTATSSGVNPFVILTATRAAVPDEVVIYRGGVLVDRQPGASLFSGTTMTYVDKTAPMNVQSSYKVYAVVNGNWSNASSTVTVTPQCTGIWLVDADAGATTGVMILGNEDQDQTQPEVAIVHRPISGPDGDPQVVRRRLSRYPREGVVAGTLVDAKGVLASSSEATLRTYVGLDAGHIYRLVLGNQNDPVIVGDVDFDEVSTSAGDGRVLDVSFNWWSQG